MSTEVDAMVDAAIAETETTPQSETPEAPAEPEAPASPEVDAPAEPETPADSDNVVFPKKAVNAISRRDKKIGKQQAQIEQLKQRLQEIEKSATVKQTASPAPNENDYASYGEYLAALATHAAREERSAARSEEAEAQREETSKQLETATAELRSARAEVITESGYQAQAAIPDFKEVIDSASVMENGRPRLPLNETAQEAFLEAGEDAAYALYSLAKEGILEDLNEMSLARAAMTISRHVDKGRALSKAKTETGAPPPVTRGAGTGKGGKNPTDMNGDELMAWINS